MSIAAIKRCVSLVQRRLFPIWRRQPPARMCLALRKCSPRQTTNGALILVRRPPRAPTGAPDRRPFRGHVDHLQVSEKTVERLARKGEIRRETRKRPGLRPLPVYSPEDLDRVKDAQVPQVAVLPPPGGGRWCSRARSPRGSSLVPSIAPIWRGRAAKGQIISHRQRGRSILRASRIHDPPLAQGREAPRRQSGRVEDSPGGPRRIGL